MRCVRNDASSSSSFFFSLFFFLLLLFSSCLVTFLGGEEEGDDISFGAREGFGRKFTKVFLTFSRLFFTNSGCVCAIFEAIYRHFDVQKMANFLPFPSPFSVVAFFYWCVIVKEKGGGKKREMSAEGKSP